MRKYVTITSDASVGSSRSGFAYYIRDDTGTTKLAWDEDSSMSPFEAEYKTAKAALEVVAGRDYKLDEDDELILIHYCDNMGVVQILNNNFIREKTYKKYDNHIKELAKLTDRFDEVVGLYVESHTTKKSGQLPRHRMNRWCDVNARAMMRYGRRHTNTAPSTAERARLRDMKTRRNGGQNENK